MSDEARPDDSSHQPNRVSDAPIPWDRATEDDIHSCYRLLLGRPPDPGGLATYGSIVRDRDISVDLLVTMFLASAEYKHKHPAGAGEEPVCRKLLGFQIYASPDDWAVGQHILETGMHEAHVTNVMKRVLRPGMVFVDIGANIGFFTLLARSIVGSKGRVYAFEPNPRNVALLDLSLRANSFQDVELFPFALADSARLFVYDAQGSNGVITSFDGNLRISAASSLIRSVCMDRVLPLDRCDVLKIDVEGAEGLALKGALGTIRSHHPRIFSEFSPPGLGIISRMSGEDYLKLLFAEGYSVAVIEPSAALTDCGQDAAKVMQCFQRAGASHIDILATCPRRPA